METRLTPDFSAFLRSFAESRVEYLLIGGYAVAYHGYPRPTGDLDVWVRPTEENAARVVAALEAFGFGVSALEPALFVRPNEDEWDDVPVSIISLEDLKRNKRASGRLKDLADLDYLP